MKKGIDVSRWQGSIDWQKVKAFGIQFAILKAGGSDDGCYTDIKFEQNYKDAKAEGMPLGAYYFVGKGCTSSKAGKADAQRFIDQLKGKQFEYPVFMDCEVTPYTAKKGATDAAIAFCETLDEAGYFPGIYGSTYSTFKDRLDDSRLSKYAHWVAQYADKCAYSGEIGIWQYTSKGKVSGINGNVDMDYSYIDYPALIKKQGKNGFKPQTESAEPKYTPLVIDGDFGIKSVKRLQEFLNLKLNMHLAVDGDFGIKTAAALQMFLNKEMR